VYDRIHVPALEDGMVSFPWWKRYIGGLTLTIEEQYECWKKIGYPTYFKMRAFHFMMICSTKDPNVSSSLPRADIYQTYKPFFGQRAILFQEGSQGNTQRNWLNKGFSSKMLNEMGIHFLSVATRLRFNLKSSTSNLPTLLGKATLESVASAGFHMDLAHPIHEQEVISLKHMMNTPGSRVMLIPYVGSACLQWWYKNDLHRVRNLIDVTISSKTSSSRPPLLETIVQAARALFYEDEDDEAHEWIRDQMKIMYVGGTDTTSLTLHWILMLLARYPTFQETMRNEIHQVNQHVCSVFGFNDVNEIIANIQTIEKSSKLVETITEQLVYTEWFINETLRLYGPVSGPLRKPTSNHVFGIDIPSECLPYVNVMHNSSMTHRDGRVFPNPTDFFPIRWQHPTPEMNKHFTPFGYGSRTCIGKRFAMMEMKLFLWVLLQGDETFKPRDKDIPFPSQVYAGTMYGPSHDYPISFS
jgi:cytochrome P450